ncbi:ectoine/hydroxyectoine ABC transporter permease subunit EhuC [Sinomonas humi]|uniref:Amino acid ABC transporter permease n=1 Tax=Sinomonas humi TaxID=1338436 RepID=A0A0B2AMG2_9MICC|nr:ectoine/hydroxyectoine ABC transporter permease subunit EhuC [Sinomonas humi]KHL04551.1 amino acid ABC transporter permease [Sinomonas humi]
MNDFGYFLTVLLRGLVPTVELFLLGAVMGTVISFLVGLSLLHRSVITRLLARIYVEGWRGTSEVVQMFWVYFAVPVLIGFQLVPLWAGALVLGLNTGAYGAEIVRGAVQSVDRAQYEACVALNLTRAQRMTRIILPQAVPEMIPPFNNLYIAVLKGTALASLINVTEMTYQANQVLVVSYPGQTLAIFMMMLVMYLVLSILITAGMRVLERKAARMLGKKGTRPSRSASALRPVAGIGGPR